MTNQVLLNHLDAIGMTTSAYEELSPEYLQDIEGGAPVLLPFAVGFVKGFGAVGGTIALANTLWNMKW